MPYENRLAAYGYPPVDTSNVLALMANANALRGPPDPYAENALAAYVQQRQDEDDYQKRTDELRERMRAHSNFFGGTPSNALAIYKQPGEHGGTGRDGDAIDYLRSLVERIPSIDTSQPSRGLGHALTDTALIIPTLAKGAAKTSLDWADVIAQAIGQREPSEFLPVGPEGVIAPPGQVLAALFSGMPQGAAVAAANANRASLPGVVANALDRPSLPMDEASRLARAREMGFDVEAYRGLTNPYSEKIASESLYQMFSRDPDVAGGYVESGYPHGTANVLPARLRLGRNIEVDAQGRRWDRIPWNALPNDVKLELGLPFDPIYSTAQIAGAARRAGYDSATIRNVIDNYDDAVQKATTVDAIFHPKNIRSKFAAFDPAQSESTNLLAAHPYSGIPGILVNASDEDRPPFPYRLR